MNGSDRWPPLEFRRRDHEVRCRLGGRRAQLSMRLRIKVGYWARPLSGGLHAVFTILRMLAMARQSARNRSVWIAFSRSAAFGT